MFFPYRYEQSRVLAHLFYKFCFLSIGILEVSCLHLAFGLFVFRYTSTAWFWGSLSLIVVPLYKINGWFYYIYFENVHTLLWLWCGRVQYYCTLSQCTKLCLLCSVWLLDCQYSTAKSNWLLQFECTLLSVIVVTNLHLLQVRINFPSFRLKHSRLCVKQLWIQWLLKFLWT